MSNILDIPQIAVFDPGNLQNDLHIGFTGDLTKQRLEKDRQRDVLWKEIKKTVDTFATLTIFPDKQEAALKMQPVMQKYAINHDGGIEAQTVGTQQWLQEQQVNYQLELAAKALGIFESINQLKSLNDEIQQLTAAAPAAASR